ncbi:hypothetical protein STCU_12138 [Strigomonas culicis]|uniref:Secreted protein n=1 Tax=Strigomonas culicis TaxID=28005 RepID=S9UXN7_9TRYP|nr:hypothetical protein STCU_12138 [Strigomonas culicis]|eukprot:EPY15305.1 hypothetical protein STCU_12138 [Strigomonas culicis]
MERKGVLKSILSLLHFVCTLFSVKDRLRAHRYLLGPNLKENQYVEHQTQTTKKTYYLQNLTPFRYTVDFRSRNRFSKKSCTPDMPMSTAT